MVNDSEELIMVTSEGVVIRIRIKDIATTTGRITQGVRLINLEKRNDEIASVCKVLSESVDEDLQDDNVTEVAE